MSTNPEIICCTGDCIQGRQCPLRLGKWQPPFQNTDIGFVHETQPGAEQDDESTFNPRFFWSGVCIALALTALGALAGSGLWWLAARWAA